MSLVRAKNLKLTDRPLTPPIIATNASNWFLLSCLPTIHDRLTNLSVLHTRRSTYVNFKIVFTFNCSAGFNFLLSGVFPQHFALFALFSNVLIDRKQRAQGKLSSSKYFFLKVSRDFMISQCMFYTRDKPWLFSSFRSHILYENIRDIHNRQTVYFKHYSLNSSLWITLGYLISVTQVFELTHLQRWHKISEPTVSFISLSLYFVIFSNTIYSYRWRWLWR